MDIIIKRLKVKKPERRQSKKGGFYWTFYCSLGKDKGTMNCILWDATLQDLPTGTVLVDCEADLVKNKVGDKYFDKIIITNYKFGGSIAKAEQKLDDIANDFPEPQEELVDVNKEFANYDAFGLNGGNKDEQR